MAKTRCIKTKFWSDNYITNLDPLERYLFLYFITNEHTNIAGIYELPLRIMAFETGIEQEMLLKMLARFEQDQKMLYTEGWICIKNFQKNQSKNESIILGIENAIEDIPQNIIVNMRKWEQAGTGGVQEGGRVAHIGKGNRKGMGKGSITPDSFSSFWESYPNKKAKKKAEEVWRKINPDKEKVLIILAGLENAKNSPQWTKDDGQFIPHPATWLRQERWNDEVKKDKLNPLLYA